MKKNAFLTFVFACIPGAGQMYYGYMQRGLSMLLLFCAGFLLGNLVGPLVVLMPVVWMYSFFDTYDLIRHMAAGEPKPDELLWLGDVDEIKRLVPQHRRLLGWGLILVGIWAIWENFLKNLLVTLLASFLGVGTAWELVSRIPTVLAAVVLIGTGIWLLGLHPDKKTGAGLPPCPDTSAAPTNGAEDKE